MLASLFDFLVDVISSFVQWLLDLLLYVPRVVFSEVMQGLAAVVSSIPVPDFVADVGSYWSGVPSDVMFFVAPLRLGTGLAMIATAYGVRFLIRRLPFVG